MMGSILSFLYPLLYIALILCVVGIVISCLLRIAHSLEDIADSLRRLKPESPESTES